MAINPMGTASILRPVKLWFVYVSLLVALLLKLVPVDRNLILPDILVLVLVFWNVRQPRLVGIGVAWTLGMIMDVHSASVFGEHALAYTLLSYFAITIHRRVLWFSPGMQAVHLLPLFLGAQIITIGVRMAVGGMMPSLWILAESFMTAALWPLAQFVLLAPQKLPENRDNDRPI